MGHIERHLNKTDEELVLRLFKDWKLYSGGLFDNIEELIHEKLNSINFNFSNQEVISLNFKQPAGFGYNRRLEKILSYIVKVVVVGNNKNYEIITAYPDLDNGYKTGEYFLFNEKLIEDINVWNLFNELYNEHLFDVRLVLDNNPHIRINLNHFSIKIKNNKFTIIDSTYYNPKKYTFNLPETFSNNQIINLLNQINKFKETHSIFGNQTIEKYVLEYLL